MKFKKITFDQFLSLEAEEMELYKAIGLSINPRSWNVSEVLNWDFITVKKIQDMFNKPRTYQDIIEIIQMLTGYDVNKIMLKFWFDVFAFHNFVAAQIERVNELEEKLSYEPDVDQEKAGIEQYNQFGYFTTVDRLADGDVTKYDEVGAMDYATIYTKLLLNKLDAEYNKRLIEIKNRT